MMSSHTTDHSSVHKISITQLSQTKTVRRLQGIARLTRGTYIRGSIKFITVIIKNWRMDKFRKIFKVKNSVIGMIHVGALPGTPRYEGSIEKLINNACHEADIYKRSGVDAVMIENMHDIPYVKPNDMGPEIVAIMTRIATEVKKIIPHDMPSGIQVLAGGNKEALSIAKSCEMQFIRAEGFVFSHIGDEGFFDASAGPLLRYRRQIGAESVLIFTDIKKKHSSHQITKDLSVVDTATAAEFFLSDGVILTGTATGMPVDQNELEGTKRAVSIPVIIGSGANKQNIDCYLAADAFIVGSHFKKDGRWENYIDEDKVKLFMDKLNELRKQ